MNTLDSAINFIRLNKAPYWRLEVRYSPLDKYTKLFAYEHDESNPDVDKVEKAVAQLQQKVGFQNHSTAQYQLFCKTSATANDNAAFGPFPFVNGNQVQAAQGQNANAFGIPVNGLGSAGVGLGDIGTVLQMREQALTDRFAGLLSTKDREWELKQKEAELAKKEQELKELEKKFNSNSESVMSGTLKAAGLLFEAWAPKGAAKEAAQGLIENISGVAVDKPKPALPTPAPVEEEETREEKLVGSIASNIYQHYQDEASLMAIGTLVHEILKNPEMVAKYKDILKNKQKPTDTDNAPPVPDTEA